MISIYQTLPTPTPLLSPEISPINFSHPNPSRLLSIHPFQAWWPSKMKRSFATRLTFSESGRSKGITKKCIPHKIAGDFCCLSKMKEIENLMLNPFFWRSLGLENTVLCMLMLFCSICSGSGVEGRQRGNVFKACCFGIYMCPPSKWYKLLLQF